MPSHLPADVRRLLEPIRLLVLDVDGVLTDGTLVYTADGEVSKAFHARDGLIIRMLLDQGIQVAIITGRCTEALRVRCSDLGISENLVAQASRDKIADLDRMAAELGLGRHEIAAMGDDLPDLAMLTRVGFCACPADAAPEVVAACNLVCRAPGGRGAVRELGELILKAKGLWIDHITRWTRHTEPQNQDEQP